MGRDSLSYGDDPWKCPECEQHTDDCYCSRCIACNELDGDCECSDEEYFGE